MEFISQLWYPSNRTLFCEFLISRLISRHVFYLQMIQCLFSNVYNMSGRVVSDIQTRAEGESLYIRYNKDANVVNNLKNVSSYEFIGEVILKINVV
jgi:hypothetical protein